jgi:hypothetical protein
MKSHGRPPNTRRTISRGRYRQWLFEPLERRDLLAGIELGVLGSYYAPGDATTEITAYDPTSQRAFYTSATSNALGIIDLSNPASPSEISQINLAPYGGGPNSVAVKNGLVAVAVEANEKTDPGSVVFFDADGVYLGQVTVGALPDMLTFTPDGLSILVANEGEPNSYNQPDSVDPKGSVSIVDVSAGIGAATVTTIGFSSFNDQKDALIASGVRIFGPGASVAQDLEPEYITVSPDGTTAYVSLQENNALAIIDLASASVAEIKALGFKDHLAAGNGLDASDRDVPGASNSGILNIQNWPVLGMYMPDALASFSVGGETFIVSANEGDARDYDGFAEEARIGSLTLDAASFAAQGFTDVSNGLNGLRNNDNLGRLNVTTTLGNTDGDAEYEELYSFGARSFSIWNAAGELVFDSGDDFEQITAAAFPTFFNASNEDNNFDSRSENKGPEPEAVMVTAIGSRTYAFVGLERIGGIMVYDVTVPTAPTFVQYLNNRDFSQPSDSDAALDLGLEDLKFISADDSPTGTLLVLASNEISGTVTVFAINLTSGIEVIDGVLEIVGTDGQDVVDIGRKGNQVRVSTNFASPAVQYFPFGEIDAVHVLLGAGNDRAVIDTNVKLPVTFEGWTGSDILLSGGGDTIALGGDGDDLLSAKLAASAVLVGGDGNDLLHGGRGRNVLIGGMGNDLLLGGSNQDLLIGGTTTYDQDLAALAAIRDFWAGVGSLASRRVALETGIEAEGRTVKLTLGETVQNDEAVDLLLGGSGQDWLLKFGGDLGI